MLAELDGDGNVKCVYTHGDEIISQKRNGTTSFYLFDGHGNTRMLADIDGNITDTYTYDAFGNIISQTGETENNYLYCGEQYDGTTGYYYLRARYMNPQTGTFVTMDTYQGAINDPVSLHKYLYAGANPVMNVDPSGNMFFPIVDASVDKIKAAWDKMVVTYAQSIVAKIGISNAIYMSTMYAMSADLRENILNLVTGKGINTNTKGVFGEGIGIGVSVCISVGVQMLFVWDTQLNFGTAITITLGGGFGISCSWDYIFFPNLKTIYDLDGNSGAINVGGENMSVDFIMTDKGNGVSTSINLAGAELTTALDAKIGRGFFETISNNFTVSYAGKWAYTKVF